jgi:uncharacterized protein
MAHASGAHYRLVFLALLAILCGPLSPPAASAEPGGRVAIVIGNNAYPAAPLRNATNDAALVARALVEIGFTVNVHLDVTSDQVPGLLEEVREGFEGAEIGLIYYAGHAFQYNGQNQLLSVDVPELSAEVIEDKRLPLRDLLAAADSGSGAAGTLRVVILDGCRNDPFSTVGPAYSRGLAFEESGADETLIAFSTGAGRLAFDGPANGNSPFAIALTRALERPGVTVSEMLRSVRRTVRLATDARQIPWVVGSMETDFQLRRDREPTLETAGGADQVALDQVVWWAIHNEIDPDELTRFVQTFPDSAFAPDATSRLREIELASSDTGRAVVIDGETVDSDAVATVLELRGRLPAGGTYEPDSSIPAELFAVWPSPLPETPGGLGELVSDCDLVAADPDDQQRVGPGVDWGLVNVRRAVRTCGYALARDPVNSRLAFQLARVLDIGEEYNWARYFYTASAQAGYAAAMTNLGYMAVEGRGGEINYPAAAAWYRRAAALGNLRARTNIGEIYLKGQGVPPNFEEAILWYRLASSMGWPNAQNALADMYRKGQGVEKDERASAALYLLAAENGQREAMNSLGRSYLNGWGVEKDREQAHLWLARAIESGDRYAPFFFARDLVARGEGETNPERIVELLQLSAERGFRDAYLELAKTYASGKIVPADPAAAFFWARLAELAGVTDADAIVAEAGAALGDAQKEEVEKLIANRQALNGI